MQRIRVIASSCGGRLVADERAIQRAGKGPQRWSLYHTLALAVPGRIMGEVDFRCGLLTSTKRSPTKEKGLRFAPKSLAFIGRPCRGRTYDQRIKSPLQKSRLLPVSSDFRSANRCFCRLLVGATSSRPSNLRSGILLILVDRLEAVPEIRTAV